MRRSSSQSARDPLVQAPRQEQMDLMETWDSKQVADFFDTKGFGSYHDLWIHHEITGARLALLTPADIEKMGVDKVGPRLGIQNELKGVKSAARKTLRLNVIAAHREAYDGSCLDEKCYTCCGCFPLERAQYELTGVALKIKTYHVERCFGRIRCACMGGSWDNDTINLDRIIDVDTMLTTKGIACLKENKCHIIIAVTAGTGAESEDSRVVNKEIFVEGEEGNEFAEFIRNQIEEYKTTSFIK